MKKTLLFLAFGFIFASVLPAKTVKGTVSGEEGGRLAKVIVTDGENFTMTDRKGRFRFEISDKADFVYVITPKGYTAPFDSGAPQFHRPADGSSGFDFTLVKSNITDDYAIIAMADTQAADEKQFEQFRTTAMPDLQATIRAEKLPAIGIVLGDICWDAMGLLPEFKKEFAKTGIPVYPVIGNHDHLRSTKGDYDGSVEYRRLFGPENYAFALGNDFVIVLDNVIYDNGEYDEGYTDAQLVWVEKLLSFIPEDAHIYIAQHCAFENRNKDDRTGNAGRMLEILEGRSASILSGHTHINRNIRITPEIMEFNVASVCGSWWMTPLCTDGTPGGYKVFEMKGGKLNWYYKALGKPRDYKMEVFCPGQSKKYPNAILVNLWDYDTSWKVVWYQDGTNMGKMKRVRDVSPEYTRQIGKAYKGKKIPGYKQPQKSRNYFIAVPDQYAETVTIEVTDNSGNVYNYNLDMNKYIDVQAHRGGAGLMPENTVSAMKNAIDMGVNTLELDLQICAGGNVVVSHDAYFHSRYATRPDGSLVGKNDPKEYLYKMTYEEIRKYDTGMRPCTVWPEQANIAEHKPLASELIDFVEKYTAEKGLTPMRYNIEIKSRAGKGEGVNWPEYHEFVDLCVELLLSKNLGDRLVVQSFDTRALNYMNEKYPELILSYLVDNDGQDFDTFMGKLDFTPVWLSPHHTIVDADMCRKAAEMGMKLVPWTADKPEDIQRLVDLGVEAIISNYPDRVLKITRGFGDLK